MWVPCYSTATLAFLGLSNTRQSPKRRGIFLAYVSGVIVYLFRISSGLSAEPLRLDLVVVELVHLARELLKVRLSLFCAGKLRKPFQPLRRVWKLRYM